MEVTPTTNTTTNFTQPAECYYSRDTFPSLGTGAKDYTMVPLYQQANPHTNMTAVLQSCCNGVLWLYSNPKPCTAVCNSTSSESAQHVRYCLNAEHVDYAGDTEDSGASHLVLRSGVNLGRGSWVVLLLGWLVLGRLMG